MDELDDSCPTRTKTAKLIHAGKLIHAAPTWTTKGRIRVPGLEVDVLVDDVGAGVAGVRESIDAALRIKYGSADSGSMVTTDAAATTLQLGGPDRGPEPR